MLKSDADQVSDEMKVSGLVVHNDHIGMIVEEI